MTAKELLKDLEEQLMIINKKADEYDLKRRGAINQSYADYYEQARAMCKRRAWDYRIAIQLIKDRLGG